eukprot:TRINITY_DN21409_c0_g1_i1.p1 TRINITY_DN21409_c0_g1~~TRINITY_DN21409_c0_g1_i1.p1  ORF type:complete len:276 (-),score=45.28 TRINITY_DN21409_c0_g1_i1:127-954(-)
MLGSIFAPMKQSLPNDILSLLDSQCLSVIMVFFFVLIAWHLGGVGFRVSSKADKGPRRRRKQKQQNSRLLLRTDQGANLKEDTSSSAEDASATEVVEEVTPKESVAGTATPPASNHREVFVFVEALEKSHLHALAQARSISMEAFDEDTTRVSRGAHVAALLNDDGEVVAFATYAVRHQLGSLNILKLAVPRTHRRRGLGRLLVRHLVQMAKRRTRGQSALEVVCLSSLPTAISFYKACAFREEPSVKLQEDGSADGLEEGQVYMEFRLQRKRCR